MSVARMSSVDSVSSYRLSVSPGERGLSKAVCRRELRRSASTMRVFCPALAMARARFVAVVVLPSDL